MKPQEAEVKYLTPSEIELWELARRALPFDWPTDPEWWHEMYPMPASEYLAAASAKRTLSLLETLEKTRALALRLLDHGDFGYGCATPISIEERNFLDPTWVRGETRDEATARRLAGFSGDAPSEEK